MSDPVITEDGLIQVSVTFTNTATPPVPTDPTTVTFTWSVVDEATRLKAIAGPTTYPNGDSHIVHDSVGVFHVQIDTTGLAGLLRWKFVGTGAVQQVWDGQLVIRATTV